MVGQNIGKYRVLDRIGRGGMGTVYRAIDETLHRDVAIKVLNAELNDPEVAKRFRGEAITVARLSHPGIATIYELFQHEGQWLMVMEFVRGETLEHMVDRMGALSPQRSAELCMQVLAALAHAHSMGVVHRDLKPANLMITETGAIKVMDFGIARVAGTEHLTSAGFMMGTPAYMAPEQVMGHEIDARADLYAMGVVFYRLTTAKLPFKGDTPFAMAQSQVNDAPTPIGLFRADLPPWVQQVVVRSLAKSLDERFQSAVEFHEALSRCLAGLPMMAAYSSSAPTELMMTPPRPMPTGALRSTLPLSGEVARPAPQSSAIPSGTAPVVEAPTPATAPASGGATGPFVDGPTIPSSATAARATDAALPAPARNTRTLAIAGVVLLVLFGVVAIVWFGGGSTTPPPAEVAALPPSEVPASTPNAAPPSTDTPAPPPDAPAVSSGGTPAAVPPASVAGADAARGGTAVPPSGPASARGASSTVTGRANTATTSAGTATDVAHQAFRDVKVLIVNGRRADDRDVVLSLLPTQLSLQASQGGSAVAALPYKAVVRGTYVRARDPRWDTTLTSPPENLDVPGGLLRTAKHWLTLQTADSFLILRLDDKNWTGVVQALESRGLTITRAKSDGNK